MDGSNSFADSKSLVDSNRGIPPLRTLTFVAILPLCAWFVYRVVGMNIRYVVLAGLVIVALGVLFGRPSKANQNQFISSGLNPAAAYSQELILSKKGGLSNNSYWCDPSIAFGHLNDFKYTKGPRVDFKSLLEERGNNLGPYCVDDETRSIVFVETSPDFDPAESGPFYFQSQRDNAIRLFVVPFEEYNRVIADLDPQMSSTEKLLLVYNTSRCGSTLLSKCLDKLSETRSISEPDVLTSLTHIASEANGTRDADIIELARSSCKLLCYLRRKRYPECETVCIKFRFQMVYIAHLVHEAVPDAKAIFLYRNALDVIDSMGAAFINTGAYRLIRQLGIDVFYVFSISTLPQNLPKLMPLMSDKIQFPPSCYMHLGAVCPFVLSWLSVMHYATIAQRNGHVSAAIRYEDLIVGKTELVAKLLQTVGMMGEACGNVQEQSLDSVFKKDAHAGKVTQSSRSVFNEDTGVVERCDFAYLRGNDTVKINAVLAHHEEIEHSDFVIPGTIGL